MRSCTGVMHNRKKPGGGVFNFLAHIRHQCIFVPVQQGYCCIYTCDNLSMTMLEIWFSFPEDCVLLPGDCWTASLTY